MAALRAATGPSHQRLEKRLDINSRFSELGAYRSHLQMMWGFCAQFEASLGPESFGDGLPDYDCRRKTPLLARDLIALGFDAGSVASLARCRAAPPHSDVAAAFGCLYVLEGATLGGRALLPVVRDRLGFTAEHGAAYLASYRDNVAAMWRRFGDALDAWCCVPERQISATQAAIRTFDALADWLCGRPL
jgi:heme oxygenase